MLQQGGIQAHWPFPTSHLELGYAYILTHPGVPCILHEHFFYDGLKDSIKQLIAVRKRNGIRADSAINIWTAEGDMYVAAVQDANKNDRVVLKLGPRYDMVQHARVVLYVCTHRYNRAPACQKKRTDGSLWRAARTGRCGRSQPHKQRRRDRRHVVWSLSCCCVGVWLLQYVILRHVAHEASPGNRHSSVCTTTIDHEWLRAPLYTSAAVRKCGAPWQT